MKKAVFLLIAVLIAGFLVWNFKQEKEKEQPTFQTQVNSEGAVTVEVTPVNLLSQDNATFKVSLGTHSVELNYNLKELAVLIDEKGREYKAITWDGEIGGHHLAGNLVFPPIIKDTKTIKLIIRQIGGVDRVFSWEL